MNTRTLALTTLAFATFSANAEILVADPSIVPANGRYYLVGTENGENSAPSTNAVFPLYVSEDLRSWRLAETPLGAGRILPRAEAFGKTFFWAPHLFTRGGRWYFAYTCECHWGIAQAERPEGPFRALVEFPKGKGRIDPFVLQDDDGRVYAYFAEWGMGGIGVVELSADLKQFKGEIVKCISGDQPWERLPLEPKYEALNRRFTRSEWDSYKCSPGVVEGPSVVKRHGKYVLFYSANDFRSPDYCVGAAVADSPFGPWKKLQAGAVLSRAHTGLNGTGHGDVFVKPDGSLWYVFHAHHSGIRVSPRRTGLIRLKETIGADGYPRYEADWSTMSLL